MYRRGWLNPTPAGVITWQELFACLRAIGFCRASAHGQAVNIAAYRSHDTAQTRDRGGVRRFLNIFQMSPGETSASAAMQVQHGFSTTIRDSRFDDTRAGRGAADGVASIRESRKARFAEWFGGEGCMTVDPVTSERRCYLTSSQYHTILGSQRRTCETANRFPNEVRAHGALGRAIRFPTR